MATTTKLVELFNADATVAATATNTAFIEAAYENLLGLSGDFSNKDARVAYWVEEMEGGLTRADFASTFLAAAKVQGDLLTDAEFAANEAAIAAVEALDETGLTLDAVKAAAAAASEAVEVPDENAGETFTLTTSDEEEVNGTAGNDTFVATSATLNTNDEIDGGAGTDTMNLKVTADTNATDVANVEIVNVNIATFADADVDLTNFDDVTNVNVALASSGYSDAITFTEGGAFEYDFGAGIDEVTFNQYDDGLINSGELTTLDLTGGRTLNLNAEGNITSLDTDDVDYTIEFVESGSSVALNAASAALTGDVITTGTGTLAGTVAQLGGATYAASGMTLKLITTAGDIDLEEQDIAALEINAATATDVTNAEGQVINITATSADVDVDTSDEGGSFEVNVTADDVTMDVGIATDELDSADVNITASATVDSMAALNISASTNVNVTGGDFEFDAVTEAADTNILTLTGDSDVTFTDIAVTSLEAADYTGDITITDSTIGAATSLTTGSGGDVVTISTDTNTSYTINTNAGADRLNFTAYVGAASEGLYANLGADDDTFIATAGITAVGGSYIFAGGEGTDTVDLDAAAAFDFSAATVTFDSIEALRVASTNEVFGSGAFHGVTDMTVYGTSASGELITVETALTSTALDMSGITLDSTFEGFTVDLSATNQTTTAFSATLTAGADTVTGLNTAGMKAFSIDLGAGNDEYTLGTADGSLTLGAGDDTVVFVTGGQSTVGVNTLVNIVDFTIADDTIETVANAIAQDDVGIDVSAADALGTATDISASVNDGIVTVDGTESARIDTLAEWIDVIEALQGDATSNNNAAATVYAFEFDGSTYVVETVVGNTEDNTIELTGVTGIEALGAAVAENTIVIA